MYSAYLTTNQFFHYSFQSAGKGNEKHFPNKVRKSNVLPTKNLQTLLTQYPHAEERGCASVSKICVLG